MATFWFIVVAVLWTGFLILEGFDFGVAVLHGVVGRNEAQRRAALSTIGPVWDGNEVWLVTAGAATFAAFPGWYATMFSGFYLALVLLLVALIARGAAIEFRAKRDSDQWRRRCSAVLVGSGLAAPLLVGVALGDLLAGVPIDAEQEYVGNFFDLLSGYSVFAGLTVVALTLLHGAVYLWLKSSGEVAARATDLARRFALPVALVVVAFVIWTHTLTGRGFLLSLIELAAILAALTMVWSVRQDRPGPAFVATSVTIAGAVLAIFTNLYPRVMVSSVDDTDSLTIANTASGGYALKVMTVVLVVLFPVVLVYQIWAYRVFRSSRPDAAGMARTSSTSSSP